VLLVEFQVDKRFGRLDPGKGPHALGEQLEKLVVVLAHDLGEDVEAARGGDDVVDGRHLRQCLGDRGQVAVDADADQRLAAKPHLEGVGHRDDLHDAGVEQPLDPLPHGRLREADLLGNGRVRLPPILLKVLDDRLGDVIEARLGIRGV